MVSGVAKRLATLRSYRDDEDNKGHTSVNRFLYRSFSS